MKKRRYIVIDRHTPHHK